jgi:hypothetical protein
MCLHITNTKYRLPSRLSYLKPWPQLMEGVQETYRVSCSVVSLLWSFGFKKTGSGAGCLCVTGDTKILHRLAITLKWLLSYTFWQTRSQDDAWENNNSRDRALTRVTETPTLIIARRQSVNSALGRGEWSASHHSHFNPGERTSRTHQMNVQENEASLTHMTFCDLTLILSSVSMFYCLLTYKHQWGYNIWITVAKLWNNSTQNQFSNVCSGHKLILESWSLLNSILLLLLSLFPHNFNPLKTKRKPFYLKTQFVPHSKHFSSRL